VRVISLVGSTVLLALATPDGRAQTATQQVRIEIKPINKLAVAGTTNFVIPARTTGPSTVAVASASYAVTTNEDNRRIIVALDQPMPEGVTLTMEMDAPAGAVANAPVVLSTSAQTAVKRISRLAASNLNIHYSLTTSDRAVVPDTTVRTVKVTLVSGV
jgi:hypothetical protein